MMKKVKLTLIFLTLSLAIILAIYGTYNRYNNLRDTMEIQNSIFQLVELKSANTQWDYALNQIHSDNFPHFDLVNDAAVKYQEEMIRFLAISANIQGPLQTMREQLMLTSSDKKNRMNDYLSEVAVSKNSLKFLDTLLFSLHAKYKNDDVMLNFLAHAQYQLSMFVALNQNIHLKQHTNSGTCTGCNSWQRDAVQKVNLHLALLKNKTLLSHQTKDAFYNPEHAKLLTALFTELSQVYVKEDTRHQTIQSQIITITGILVLTVISLLGFLYWVYRTIEGHRTTGITDPLTGLYNRKKLFDSLQKLMLSHEKSGKKLALLFIDLDGFKSVNDTYGHDIGDKLLQELSARLVNHVRKHDLIYRIGGDEFVIIVQELALISDAETIANNLLIRCNTPYQIEKNECNVTLSIGISLYPDHTIVPDTLIKYADEAMYQAKDKGKNRVSTWPQD